MKDYEGEVPSGILAEVAARKGYNLASDPEIGEVQSYSTDGSYVQVKLSSGIMWIWRPDIIRFIGVDMATIGNEKTGRILFNANMDASG